MPPSIGRSKYEPIESSSGALDRWWVQRSAMVSRHVGQGRSATPEREDLVREHRRNCIRASSIVNAGIHHGETSAGWGTIR
jgi:hypothetical protein